MSVKLAPSILTADFTRLGEEVAAAEAAGVDWIHVDVMDGHFVPNLTIGPLVVQALRRATTLPLDVHLMIEQPDRLIPAFANAGADSISVHIETCPHLHRTVAEIRRLGVRPGVAVNPATSLALLDDILPDLDLVLVMSVNPGFGGQDFIPTSIARLARLRQMLDARRLQHIEIAVDGGVKPANAVELVRAGATVLVSGSAIFNRAATIAENVAAFRACLK